MRSKTLSNKFIGFLTVTFLFLGVSHIASAQDVVTQCQTELAALKATLVDKKIECITIKSSVPKGNKLPAYAVCVGQRDGIKEKIGAKKESCGLIKSTCKERYAQPIKETRKANDRAARDVSKLQGRVAKAQNDVTNVANKFQAKIDSIQQHKELLVLKHTNCLAAILFGGDASVCLSYVQDIAADEQKQGDLSNQRTVALAAANQKLSRMQTDLTNAQTAAAKASAAYDAALNANAGANCPAV